MNYEDRNNKADGATGSNPADSGRPFPIFKPIPHKRWRRYFLEVTDHEMIALRLVDVHEGNVTNVEPLINSLEGPVEVYVLLWSQTLGFKSKVTVRIPSLKFFKAGRDITFRESNRQYERRDPFFRSCIAIDEGYRSLIVLVPKTLRNLRVLKAWIDERGEEIPEYYREDFEALKSARKGEESWW